MKPNLAKTSFATGADESLAAPDVYAEPPQSPIGAISDTVSGASLLDMGGFLPGFGGGLGELLSTDLSQLDSTFKNLEKGLSTVTKVLGGDKSFINDLKTGMVGDLLTSAGFGESAVDFAGALMSGKDPMSALDSLARNNPDLKVIMDGVDVVIAAKDIDSIDDLLKVAGQISGMPVIGDILQIGPHLSVIKGLVDKANFFGIPELARALIDTVTDKDEKKTLELNSALGAAQGSNLDMLEGLLNKYGSSNLKGLYPSLVKTTLTNYRYPDNKTEPTLALSSALINLCNRIDPNWRFTMRDGVQIDNTDCFNRLSKDAKELFLFDPVTRDITLLATDYPESSLMGIAQRQYPYTPMPLS